MVLCTVYTTLCAGDSAQLLCTGDGVVYCVLVMVFCTVYCHQVCVLCAGDGVVYCVLVMVLVLCTGDGVVYCVLVMVLCTVYW